MKIKQWLVPSLLILAGSTVQAQEAFPPTLDDPYYASTIPSSGAYFDPEQPGTGMFVDARQNGAIFIHLSLYDADGQPTWYVIQDWFDPQYAYALGMDGKPDGKVWHVADGIGSTTAPVYRTSGGQCLGCPYSLPVIEIATELGEVTLHWANVGHVSMSLDGTQSTWTLLPLDGDIASKIEGNWTFRYWEGDNFENQHPDERYPSTTAAVMQSVVEIESISNPGIIPIDQQGGLFSGKPPVIVATDWFSMKCIQDCDGHFWNAGYSGVPSLPDLRFAVWFDRATGRSGIQQFGRGVSSNGAAAYSYATRSFTLHPNGDRMIARRSQKPNIFSLGITSTEALGSVIEMQRVADPAH